METHLPFRIAIALSGYSLLAGFSAPAQLPFTATYDAPANAVEEQELNSLFTQARAASANISPGPDAGYQRRQLAIELNSELESFVAGHTNSAWIPGLRVWLARNAQLSCACSQAGMHFEEARIAAAGVTYPSLLLS